MSYFRPATVDSEGLVVARARTTSTGATFVHITSRSPQPSAKDQMPRTSRLLHARAVPVGCSASLAPPEGRIADPCSGGGTGASRKRLM